MRDTDICFYFDPVCPFAWMTSKWVRQVTVERDYTVDWRFISLRMINAAVDYDSHFPPGYEAGHTAGLKLLRVAARVRADYGHDRGRFSLRGDRDPGLRHRARRAPRPGQPDLPLADPGSPRSARGAGGRPG